jgi:hypothetical protein
MAKHDDSDELVRHEGRKHQGPARSSPYPVSRLAPTHDLVDMAKQIQEADHMIGTVVHSKLEVIAEQIKNLQDQARRILESANHDATLHRARCNFKRRPGQIYHLYRRGDDDAYFSMLSPMDWGKAPHEFVGSFRLETDMSWTPAGQSGPENTEELLALVGVDPDEN